MSEEKNNNSKPESMVKKEELRISSEKAKAPKSSKRKKVAIATTLTTLAMGGIAVGTILALQDSGKITVKYTANGKEEVLELDKNTKISDIQPNAVPGYIFDGWFKDPGLTIPYTDDDVLQNESILYPKFVAREYVVTYYSNNQQNDFTEQKVYFDTDFSLIENTFERSHFTFVGWSTNPNAKYSDNKLLFENTALTLDTEGLNLYAVWKGEETSVSVNTSNLLVNGGEHLIETETIFYGDTYTFPTINGEKKHNTDDTLMFAGYIVNGNLYKEGDTIKITSTSVNIEIVWKTSETMVCFNIEAPEGETITSVPSIFLEEGQSCTLPSIAECINYNFLGWNTKPDGKGTNYLAGESFTPEETTTILYAIFDGKERIINIYDEENLVETITTKYGEKITLQPQSKDGFDFLGYNTKNDYSGKSYKGEIFVNFNTSSTTLYMFWKTKEVKVYFNVNGGIGHIGTLKIKNNTTFSFSTTQIENQKQALSRKYYTLVGWSLDQEATPETEGVGFNISVVNTPRTYFAVWQRNKVSITYTTEAGVTVPLNTQIDQGAEFVLTDTGFEKEGYFVKEFVFNGQTYKVGDTIAVLDESVFSVEIQPVWEENKLVMFVCADNIETVMLSDQTKKNVSDLVAGEEIFSPDVEVSEIVENGITKYFAGWSTSQTATTPTFVVGDLSTPITVTDKTVYYYPVYMEANTECFTFTELTEDTLSVSTNDNANGQTLLIVPSVYNGKSVTTIGSFTGVSADHIILPNSITTISDVNIDGDEPEGAFFGALMKSISMSENIKTIGLGAFALCSSLTSINLPNGVETIGMSSFVGCTALANIIIPNTVQTIANYAFGECVAITKINLPDSVITIEENAFSSCTNLATLNISANSQLETIGDSAFAACESLTSVNLPKKLTSIGEGVFAECLSLSNVTFADGFQGVIGNYTFAGCLSLSSVILPEGITEISEGLFGSCENLSSVNIPSSVKTIGFVAFDCCSSLTNIDIPNGVIEIGDSAFSNCTSLINITIPDSVELIGNNAFDDCTSLVSINIPKNVTKIGINAFYNCTGLTTINYNATACIASTNSSGVFCNAGKNGDGVTINIGANVTTIPERLFGVSSPTYSPKFTTVNFVGTSQCTSIGGNAFYGCTSLTNITIPASVTTIGGSAFGQCRALNGINIPSGVTVIMTSTFLGCSSLTEIDIPDSVTSIGSSAFSSCKSLVSIEIPKNVTKISDYTFSDCSSLTNITISSNITSIGERAFYNCISLTNITIPSSVSTIGNYAFQGCNNIQTLSYDTDLFNSVSVVFSKLQTLTIGDNVTTIPANKFKGCTLLETITIGTEVQTIGDSAFYGCTKLSSINIPDSVTTIGTSAFDSCTSLESVKLPTNAQFTTLSDKVFRCCSSLMNITIPSSVTTIGVAVFSLCSSFTSIDIPDSVTSIGNNAFSNCTSLVSINMSKNVTKIDTFTFYGCTSFTSITIPSSVTIIDYCAFGDCTSLTSVTIPSSVTTIDPNAFNGCSNIQTLSYNTDAFNSVSMSFTNLKTLTIGDNVTTIPESRYANCGNLTTVTIGSGVTTIGGSAFMNCAITTINIPDSVEIIESGAFGCCMNLESVVFGSGIKTIGNWVFEMNMSLKSITFEGTTPPTNVDEAWIDFVTSTNSDLKIYVPSGLEGDYRTVLGTDITILPIE